MTSKLALGLLAAAVALVGLAPAAEAGPFNHRHHRPAYRHHHGFMRHHR